MSEATATPEKTGTRQLIVQTAFKLFSQKGYNETSVAQIAREAGISKGLMYHYFSSKEELLKGIFEDFSTVTIQNVEWKSQAGPAGSLRQLVDLSLSYLQNQPAIRRFSLLLTLQSPESVEIRQLITAGKKQWEAAFADLFQALGYHKPQAEALYLSALLDGISVRFLGSGSYPLEDLKHLIYRNYAL